MVLRKPALLSLGAAAALCVVAAACNPTGGVSPSPTSSPTPTETQLERRARLDFEAAEKAYRTFNAEFDRVSQAGGSPTPTPVMKDTAAGPYLSSYANLLKKQYEANVRVQGGVRIGSLSRQSYALARIAMLACEDGSDIRIYGKTGKLLGKGSIVMTTIDARRVGSGWKMWDFNEKNASKCAP